MRPSLWQRLSGERVQSALAWTVMVAAIAFLSFVLGNYTMFASTFPAPELADAFKAGRALNAKRKQSTVPFPTEFWQPARWEQRGVAVHDPAQAFQGYTLYTSGHDQTALLIDMDGNVVHQWDLKYSEIWDDTAYHKSPQPDRLIYYRKAMMFPNGDLIAIFDAVGDTPWGYGMVKMDKDSNLIWKYLEPTHHDIDIGPDGRIYGLLHYFSDSVIEGWGHLRPPRLDDWVVVLSPDGEELERLSVTDTFIASPYARMVNTVAWYLVSSLSWQGNGDFFHTNGIDVLDPERASHLAPDAERPVMLSMREIGAIGVVDLADGSWHWAQRGPWLGQHDPDLLPDGSILLFDNFGHYGPGGLSRVIEFDPETMEISWIYSGDEEQTFESAVRAAQERLPNGNTLITESNPGRLLEVTPEGEIVWEFRNPAVGGENEDLIAVVSWGQRYAPETLDPAFRAMLEEREREG